VNSNFRYCVRDQHDRRQIVASELLDLAGPAGPVAIAARPPLDAIVDCLPAAKIEVADAEIGSLRDAERFAQSGQKLLVDIVENASAIDELWSSSARVLTTPGFCARSRKHPPVDAARLANAAACLVVERDDDARQRGVPVNCLAPGLLDDGVGRNLPADAVTRYLFASARAHDVSR